MPRSPRIYGLRDARGRYWARRGGWDADDLQALSCATLAQVLGLQEQVRDLLGPRAPWFGVVEFTLGGPRWWVPSSGKGCGRNASGMPVKKPTHKVVAVLMPQDLVQELEDHLAPTRTCRSDWIVQLVRRELGSRGPKLGRPPGPQPETIREGSSRPK